LIVSESGALCVDVPLLPVIVSGNVPAVAGRLMVILSVELPPAVTELGVKL
jgi:hypothetical protein